MLLYTELEELSWVYGIVNKSLRNMVIRDYGEKTWEQIFKKVGLESGVFIHLNAYPDQITYDLLGAASEILNTPVDELLHAFGQQWSTHTLQQEYAEFLDLESGSFKSFLIGLPNLHSQVQLILPELNPPRFRCSEVEATQLLLHYYSDRAGLVPFVKSIIEGLGIVFQTPVKIELLRPQTEHHDHSLFRVRWEV